MKYKEIKKNKKLFKTLPKTKIISYLYHLLAYIIQLNKKIKLLEKEISDEKLKQINSKINQPSSKQAEWEDKGSNKDDKDDKKKGKKKKRKKKKGSGNKGKHNLEPTKTNTTSNKNCPNCGIDLSHEVPFETISRIVEDISEFPEETEVSEENQERVKCPNCNKKITAQSEAALPKSDIGIRTTVLVTYLWTWMAMTLPKIADFLNSFFVMNISTAGISRMMIRVGNIFEPVYNEILSDIKTGVVIFADETGWRVRGSLHWLWIFANAKSAFYWPDKSRGSSVVEKILGTCFSGLLISDAWHAYLKIKCDKQTCMAHIFRKIRKLKEAFPQYYSIIRFYERLKKIIEDAEKLHKQLGIIDKTSFKRKLKKLEIRLDDLLNWANPNDLLKDIIKKVKKQRNFILTFTEHSEGSSHNNYSEYIVKKGILKRKVSGGSTSFEGLKAFAILISICQTCWLRKISIKRYIHMSLLTYIKSGKAMLLSEYQKIEKK